ncbi:hypothetical protein QFZ41_000006 [Luteibacter sp. W1I16]|uniref:ZrgA family zinc uptake protein n=1 Tax=Luteibacter sp. W1I16 TaxID=3373922 RepID=UPI003D23A422
MPMKIQMMVFPFLLAALPMTVNAAERQLGPHVHGQASVSMSIDGCLMDVQVSVPGHDAVGFEHPPASPQERSAVDKATATLNGAAWLVPASAAGCTLSSAKVSPHGFGDVAEPGGHADFDAEYHYACRKTAELDHVDVRLASAFPAVRKVVVNIITAAGSNQQDLDGTVTRVDVRQ